MIYTASLSLQLFLFLTENGIILSPLLLLPLLFLHKSELLIYCFNLLICRFFLPSSAVQWRPKKNKSSQHVILNSLESVAKMFSTKQIMKQMAGFLHFTHLFYKKEKRKKIVKSWASNFVAGSIYNKSFPIAKLFALPKVPSFSYL